MKSLSLGLQEALSLTLKEITPLSFENVPLVDGIGRVSVSDLYALVDSPSVDASLKDGYALRSRETVLATADNPIRLFLLGAIAAGGETRIFVEPGTAVKIMTGAPIPVGADAVIPREFVEADEDHVLIGISAESGRNILLRGSDVPYGKCVLSSGQRISPGIAGLLAAAGHDTVTVYRNPVVGIVGTGDEIIEPGKPMAEGKLYASNVVTLAAWCKIYGMETRTAVVRDDYGAISESLMRLYSETDAILTTGGAWTGDHDLMARVLDGLEWKKVFHRIRMGPGKPTGFGIFGKKPLFMLSGGPTSSLTGFLQIALPGLLMLSGHRSPGLPMISARLARGLQGRDRNWTDVFYGTIRFSETVPTFYPLKGRRSRLISLADATAVASIPEGQDHIRQGSVIIVQLLDV